ncbi:hypothetical protein ACN38_g9547, partial [Penicillium nordicum]
NIKRLCMHAANNMHACMGDCSTESPTEPHTFDSARDFLCLHMDYSLNRAKIEGKKSIGATRNRTGANTDQYTTMCRHTTRPWHLLDVRK